MSPSRCTYRGRFAPSPSGPLHFGSLVAAVGSFADARAAGGQWLLRIEDLDTPRVRAGAAAAILDTLRAFGLDWDGPVLTQSTRLPAYAAALTRLRELGLVYPCACSRQEVAALGRPGPEGPLYPGTCRRGLPAGRSARGERIVVGDTRIDFTELVHGPQSQQLARAVGDFVLLRADGVYAYQLAVVVDDAAQGISRVVRGADLLASTARQIWLQRLLGLPHPEYAHLPLVRGPDGRKLSKSLAALPVDPSDPLPALRAAWAFLGQPPVSARGVAAFWAGAIGTWSLARVPLGD